MPRFRFRLRKGRWLSYPRPSSWRSPLRDCCSPSPVARLAALTSCHSRAARRADWGGVYWPGARAVANQYRCDPAVGKGRIRSSEPLNQEERALIGSHFRELEANRVPHHMCVLHASPPGDPAVPTTMRAQKCAEEMSWRISMSDHIRCAQARGGTAGVPSGYWNTCGASGADSRGRRRVRRSDVLLQHVAALPG